MRLLSLLFLFLVSSQSFGSYWILPGGGSREPALSPQIGEYATVDLTSTGTITIGSHPSEAGILVGVYIGVFIFDTSTPTGLALDMDLVITVDSSTYTEPIYNSTCAGSGVPCFSIPFQDLDRATEATEGVNPGNEFGTNSQLFLNIPYSSSLTVEVVVNTAASNGNINVSMFRMVQETGQTITERTITELQAPVGTYIDIYTNAPINTDIIDQDPESGILHSIGVAVLGFPPTSTFNLADDPLLQCDLNITLDGTLMAQRLYDGGCASGERFDLPFQALGPQIGAGGTEQCTGEPGTGGGVGSRTGDWLQIPYHARYFDSILVNLSCLAQVTAVTNAGVAISVLRSTI